MDSEEIIKNLETSEAINDEDGFRYAQICSKYLRNKETELEGRKIIINVLNNLRKISKPTRELWTDLVESAGFYPYLEKDKLLSFRNTAGEIRKEFHKSRNSNIYFHDEQMILDNLLESGKNLILSAPTSFGKSNKNMLRCVFNLLVLFLSKYCLSSNTSLL